MAKAFPNTGVTTGLAADRTAMTGMTAGTYFYETDTKKISVYNGSSWVEINDLDNTGGLPDGNVLNQLNRLPSRADWGKGYYANGATINFTAGRFTASPILTTGMNTKGAYLTYVITSDPTSSSFSIEYAGGSNHLLSWIAFQT
jgi:hypothetical protein